MSALTSRQVRSSSVIGLDIGSSAVRAAELVRSRRGLALHSFGQVGIAPGAVIDGEIVEPGVVVTALRRLWSEAGFRTRNVILTVSGQRVMVRQADVPSMSESDFRSALRFQAMDLVPIPVDDALLDFVIIPPSGGTGGQQDRMQILLGAAHRSVVATHLAVLREASLRAVAVDPAPMAASRAAGLSPGAAGGTVALLDVGADLTLVTVRQDGRVRFSRTLNSGGSDLTGRLVGRLGVDFADAEGLKRHPGATGPAGDLLVEDVDPLVSEIESSLSFFASQLGAEAPASVWLTGGGSLAPDLTTELARRLSVPVSLLDPFEGVECSGLELDPASAAAASPHALLAIGAAAWAFEPPARRLSLVPRELAEEAKARRQLVATGAGVAVVIAALAGGGLVRSHQASQASAQAAVTTRANQTIQARIDQLAPISQFQTAVKDRLASLGSDQADDIAWSRLLAEISAAMPPGTKLTGLNVNDADASTGSPSSSSSSGSADESSADPLVSGGLGSVTMTVSGPGSEEEVAIWLKALADVKGLTGVWIPSGAVSGGAVTFSSTGGITTGVPLVTRPAQGSKS